LSVVLVVFDVEFVVELLVELLVVLLVVLLVLFPNPGVLELVDYDSTGINEYLGMQKSNVAEVVVENNVLAKLFPEQSVKVISMGREILSDVEIPYTILTLTTATNNAILVLLPDVKYDYISDYNEVSIWIENG